MLSLSSLAAGTRVECVSSLRCPNLLLSSPSYRISTVTSNKSCSRTSSTSSTRRSQRLRAVELGGATSAAVSDLATTTAPPPVDVSWQIVVGSFAGITPFIIAGIEFSKRIIEQRKCEICRGSGLLLKGDIYIRCPNCGGFLPWQSWRRFFTG